MPAEEEPTTSEPQKFTDSSGLGQPPLPCKHLLSLSHLKLSRACAINTAITALCHVRKLGLRN